MREEIIRESLRFLRGVEEITDYHPGEEYYAQVTALLEETSEEKLQEAFESIVKIATESIDMAVANVKNLDKEARKEDEKMERLEEAKEILSLLSM